MPNFSMIEKVVQQECAIDYLVSKYTFLLWWSNINTILGKNRKSSNTSIKLNGIIINEPEVRTIDLIDKRRCDDTLTIVCLVWPWYYSWCFGCSSASTRCRSAKFRKSFVSLFISFSMTSCLTGRDWRALPDNTASCWPNPFSLFVFHCFLFFFLPLVDCVGLGTSDW